MAKKGNDIEVLYDEIDTTRTIREISMRVSMGNALCALTMADEKGENIVDIEWENFDLGREWKTQ